MMKSNLQRNAVRGIVVASILDLTGCSINHSVTSATVVPSNSVHVLSDRQLRVKPDDRKHLYAINAKAPKGDSISTSVKNLYFDAGTMLEGEKPVFFEEMKESAFAKNIPLTKIRTRVAYLNQYDSPSEFKVTESYDPYLPGKKRTWAAIGFNLIGQKVKQPDGSTKLYFTRVQEVSYELGNNVGKPAPHISLTSMSRSDFVNPEDIDWVLGVQDFTKIAR